MRCAPLVTCDSELQACAYLGEYALGAELFAAIEAPTPREARWAGLCLRMLGRLLESEEVLLWAVAQGDAAARIDLARTWALMGRRGEALRELDHLEAHVLEPPDRVWFHRARADLLGQLSSYFDALPEARAAWRDVQGLPEFPLFAPWVLLMLADVLSQVGEDHKALFYLDRAAALTASSDSSEWFVRLNRAHVLVKLGRTAELEQEIATLERGGSSGSSTALWMLRARAAWAVGRLPDAIASYTQAAFAAHASHDDVRESMARSFLAALLTHAGETREASEHVARAENLARMGAGRSTFALYGTHAQLRLGHRTPEEALSTWRPLCDALGRRGETHDQRWAQLHLCHATLLSGNDVNQALHELNTLVQRYQNAHTLAKDWLLVPELRRAVSAKTASDLGALHATPLELWTLGEERLVVDGATVHLPMRKSLEVLAYLLEVREATLPSILSHVFAEDDPARARNYFHQLRHVLSERVPGCRIHFDKHGKTYSLECDRAIWWDVAEVRGGRHTPREAVFLPSSGSEWAARLTARLQEVLPEDGASLLRDRRTAPITGW